jgi:hypothetical protein
MDTELGLHHSSEFPIEEFSQVYIGGGHRDSINFNSIDSDSVRKSFVFFAVPMSRLSGSWTIEDLCDRRTAVKCECIEVRSYACCFSGD